jgi:hypothetical protein
LLLILAEGLRVLQNKMTMNFTLLPVVEVVEVSVNRVFSTLIDVDIHVVAGVAADPVLIARMEPIQW